MRIREILFQDFRAFRGKRRISFVDPLTDAVRPVSVLAGSNGSGKTTVLDAIEAMLALLVDQSNLQELVKEVPWWGGQIRLTVEFSPNDFPESVWSNHAIDTEVPETVTIYVGKPDRFVNERPGHDSRVFPFEDGKGSIVIQSYPLQVRGLLQAISQILQGSIKLRGGSIYFPYDRRLEVIRSGSIERPPEKRSWLFRFSTSSSWQGSLEQLWVWQNYLDLEQSAKGRKNLIPFVESVEKILGNDRRIKIDQGRVFVPVSWGRKIERPEVRLDQLPSGEQQVLLLFGELARQRREGAVIAVDEVENSLHPTLQRLVMWNLRRLASEWDAQVIVATHSLEVINTVRGGAFVNLDYPNTTTAVLPICWLAAGNGAARR